MISTESTLRVARISARIKLIAAAEHINMTATALSAAERLEGPITARQVVELAGFYGVEVEALHGRKPLVIAAQPPSMCR